MRLLVVTQTVALEDPALGFFHGWILEFAKRCESLEVICLKEGKHELPGNVQVHSLGKERGRPALGGFAYAARFLREVWRFRHEHDVVFVHMNPEYVVLAGLFWRMWGKRVVLWYTHRQVNLKLRIALIFADAVATASPESLRLRSSKVRILGHGIAAARFDTVRDGTLHDSVRIVSVGRITPIKRLEILIEALALLRKDGIPAEATLVGGPTVPSDHAYQDSLRAQATRLDITEAVHFAGVVPYDAMPTQYRDQDISVNLAPTGGMDKAVLESMASGCIPLVANRAFASLFKQDADRLLFEPNAEALAEKLRGLARLPQGERASLAKRLSDTVRKEADTAAIIVRLLALYA
jgi:glycosyltransferase involved in cell wall biosynthesis